MTDTSITIRIPQRIKDAWVKQAKQEGLTLTAWMTYNLNSKASKWQNQEKKESNGL